MKKSFYLIIALMFTAVISKAQTTAMDFTKTDCSGQTHQLFTELDSGQVAVMEFVMTCNSCIAAGHAIEAMVMDLQAEFPGRVKWYQFAYTNSYTCSMMTGWKNTNGFNSAIFDQGASLVAYYGGFGMPTIAVAAGSGHDVLFTDVGFSISDTTAIGIAARNYFATTAVNELPSNIANVNVYPNPASDLFSVELSLKTNSNVTINLLDISGRIVREISNEKAALGNYKVNTNLSDISNGVYTVQIISDGKSINKRINITR